LLTNLDWLEEGKDFPPKIETDRLRQYRENADLYESKHPEVWRTAFEHLAKRLRRRSGEVRTIFNYQQLLSKKTADFVCGEPITLEYEGDTDKLEATLARERFNLKLYELIIDVSRFGNGIGKVVDERLTVVPPGHWFPVVDPGDLKHITQHVIAFPTHPDNDGKPTQLRIEIHTKGNVETREHTFSARADNGLWVGKIGAQIADPVAEATNLNDFAVFALSNATHSGSLYGIDDYAAINSLVQALMWRLHRADAVMDKHSDPSISGPSSALELDEATGLYLFRAGDYFTRDRTDDPDINYVTWDGNLDSNFKEIDLLFNQLYVISEMGAAFVEGTSSGGANSGTALKLRLVSPRIKAQRITGINDATVRAMIAALGMVNGVTVIGDQLTLRWNDGLPNDPVEDAQRRNVETGGKQTKSQYSAIKERGLSDAEVEAELEQIRLEAAANSANILGVVDPFAEDDELEGVSDGDTT